MREAQKAYAFPGGCADAVKGVERERERESKEKTHNWAAFYGHE